MGGMPYEGVFLRDPSRIYASFGENHGKLRTARLTRVTGIEPGTPSLPVSRAETLSHWLGEIDKG